MTPEIRRITERIASSSGDLVGLWRLHCVNPISIENWRLGVRVACMKWRYAAGIQGLLCVSILILNAISLMDRQPQNHIEQLKPLIASLSEMPAGHSHGSSQPDMPMKAFPIKTPKSTSKAKTASNTSQSVSFPAVDASNVSKKKSSDEKSQPEDITVSVSKDTDKPSFSPTHADVDKPFVDQSGTNNMNKGDQWGTQQTALSSRSPMHFRKINGPNPIWVAETEVTQRQWVTLMGLDLSVVSGHWDQAVDGISWCKALEYANRLSKHEKRKPVYRFKGKCEKGGRVIWDTQADGYRLLNEQEWQALASVSVKETTHSLTNNRGVGKVYANQNPQKDGIYGLQSNAAEWVWGTTDEMHQTQNSAVAARKCIEDNCRQISTPSERPLGVGLRLARGALNPNASSDI